MPLDEVDGPYRDHYTYTGEEESLTGARSRHLQRNHSPARKALQLIVMDGQLRGQGRPLPPQYFAYGRKDRVQVDRLS